MKRFTTCILLSTILLLGTSGCDKVNKMSQDLQDSVKNTLQEAQDNAVAKNNFGVAYDHMVSCNNSMTGSIRVRAGGSVSNAFTIYQKQKLGEATAKKRNPDAIFDPDSFERCIKELKEANKFDFQGKYVPIGNASKALVPTLETFGKTVREMEDYLTSKAYLDDDFAKGRELDKKYMEEAPPFIKAFEQFDKELTSVEAIRTQAHVASLKSSGKMRSAFGYEAYANIQQFLMALDSGDPSEDEALKGKLDQLITATADSLNSMKDALGKTKDKNSSNLQAAYDDLMKMLGYMREAKQKNYKPGRSLSNLVDTYNHFVSFTLSLNRMEEKK